MAAFNGPIMSWTNNSQARLNHLRNRELAGTLTEPEQVELAALMAEVEAEEARSLAPAMQRLRAEVHELEREIATVQGENEESARLLARQQASSLNHSAPCGTGPRIPGGSGHANAILAFTRGVGKK
jgi:hypothetical protein